jgi:hypothetical protein
MLTKHKDILDIERRFWEEANNPKLYETSMTDDAMTIIEPMGYVDKKQAVEMSSKGAPFKDVEMQDIQMRELTPECVALAYHGKGIQQGKKEPYHGSICSVYVRKDNEWKLAVTDHQPWHPEQHGK